MRLLDLLGYISLHAKLLSLRLAIRRGENLESLLVAFKRILSRYPELTRFQSDAASFHLRWLIRSLAHCSRLPAPSCSDLLRELSFLNHHSSLLTDAFRLIQHKRVLYCGQAYYNSWYLSRALRKLRWKADLLDWDENPSSQLYYHGADYRFIPPKPSDSCAIERYHLYILSFYLRALYAYDIFHFANAHGICFGHRLPSIVNPVLADGDEIRLIRRLGKSIVYSNNGCLDGVSPSSFAQWGPESVCSICRWQHEPSVCSDERNLAFGKFRNEVSDFQCLFGGNRADYNLDPSIHEVPEFYCLSPKIWRLDLRIPTAYRHSSSHFLQSETVLLYHAVGNLSARTREDGVNIKSTHIYLPLVDRLKSEGLPIDLISPTGIPNKKIRYLQAQADIFLDMLTYGWFGANAREAMMLGKPVICFIRPEWLECLRAEIPDYADELPIVSATPDTVETVLRTLITDRDLRETIGKRSRDFALKWHSDLAAAHRFNVIYANLLHFKSL